jgi:hypothetical protein
MMESQQYAEIGAWWHPRKGNTDNSDNEIDIVTVRLDGKVQAYEVKRNKKKYSQELLNAKVADMSHSAFGNTDITVECLSLEDM